MNKSLVIKLVTALVVAMVVYSVFWFFKLGQLEKRVNKFVSENSAHVSIGEISVSGFPFSQKISIKDLKFSIPAVALDKRQIVVKHLEASAEIFASEFVVTLPEPVTVQDQEGVVANVEFNSAPQITASIADGRIVKLHYQDSGYRITEGEKGVIYAASSSLVTITSEVGEGDKIITKINADVKDIENFTILDIYKNSLEKSIINGLKTGEIAIGSAATALIPAQLDINAAIHATAQAQPAAPEVASASLPAVIPATNAPTSTVVADVAPIVPAPVIDAVVKNNFVLNAEYVLAPNHIEQQPPLDPTQIQELPLQYTKSFKIIDLRFFNSLYNIMISGEMTALADDSMPSGGLTIKVENIDNVIKQAVEGLSKIIDKSKPTMELNLTASNLTAPAPTAEDSYTNFLIRISSNLSNVTKEIASKNVVSKESIVQFDVRREKNLDFLVNETPLREVIGKF